MATVTTIIASAGAATRLASINTAVDSVLAQSDVQSEVLVVLNGPNVSDDVVRSLEHKGVRIERLALGSLPHALHHGVKQVESEFFSFLDDDDLYLPGALAARVEKMRSEPELDVVVANGYWAGGEKETPVFGDDYAIGPDPLAQLFERNWLASCGGLYRASTVGPEYFREDAKYFEWTMTAFLLGLDRKIGYVPKRTFKIMDTPDSLSKSSGYVLGYPEIMQKMLAFDVPPEVRAIIRRRFARGLHTASEQQLEANNLAAAWRYHLRSLKVRDGLQYLPYTWHLMTAGLLRRRGGAES